MTIIVVAVLALVFLISLVAPVAGPIMLALLLPAYLVRLQIAWIPSTLLELSTYTISLALLARYFIDQEFREKVKDKLKWVWREKKFFVLAVSVFFTSAFISTFITVDMQRSMGILKGWFFDPFLFAVIVFLTAKNRFSLYKIITALSVMAAALSGYGIIDFFSTYDPFTTTGVRLDSVFSSPNYYALLVGPIITLSFAVLVLARELWKKPAYLSLLLGGGVLNIIALYLTYSYGGYLGVSLGMFVVLIGVLLVKKINKKTAIILLSLFAAAVLSVTAISISSDKFQRDFYNIEGESSFRGRFEVWNTGAAIIKHHPVFGLGWGNYDKGYKQYVHEVVEGEPLEPVMIHAHNIFLDFWTDGGVIGLLSFLLLLAALFKLFWSASIPPSALAYGGMGALTAIMGHGLVDTPYFKNDLSFIFWFVVALLLYINYARTKLSENIS